MKYTYTVSLIAALTVMLVFNQWQISFLHRAMPNGVMMPSTIGKVAVAGATGASQASLPQNIQALAQKLIAKGIPPVYGAELQVSFDNAADAMPKLSRFEQDSRPDKLTGETLERYIAIGQGIACEFCCTATAMVFPDGRKACACAHSAAMRGVAAYLLTTPGQTMNDNQILTEVAKWKSVFFPGPTVNKYLAQTGQGNAAGLQSQVGGC